MSGQLLTWAATSAIVVVIPRYLGDANIGKLTFAWGFTGVFGALILFGSTTYLTRAIARDPGSAAHLTYNALVARLPVIAVATAAIVLLVNLLGYPESTRNIVYIAAAAMAVSTFGSIIASALQGMERMTLISVLGVIEKVLIAIFGLSLLVFAGKGLSTWALVVMAVGVLMMVILLVYFWRVAGYSFRLDPGLWRTLFKGGAPFMAWNLALIVYGGIDVTMLSLMTQDRVVGWYGTAYRFVGIPAFIPFAVTTALLPSLSNAGEGEFRGLARRCMDVVVLVTMPIAVILLVGAGTIIHFFDYPHGFDHSIIPLRILALHVPLVAISMVTGTVLIARNQEGAWLRVGVVAAVLNPLLNLAAIPYFDHVHGNGAIGASITTVVTEAFVVVAGLAIVERGMFTRSNVVASFQCLAAAVPMTVVMFLAAPLGLFPLLVLGTITYAVAALAFGAVRIDDLRRLPDLVLSRPSLTNAPTGHA